MVRIILGSLGEFIGPSVDDWVAIDVIDAGDDALLEFMLRCHADVTQDGAGELGEEALNEVEPGGCAAFPAGPAPGALSAIASKLTALRRYARKQRRWWAVRRNSTPCCGDGRKRALVRVGLCCCQVSQASENRA